VRQLLLGGNRFSGNVPDFAAFTNVSIDVSGNYLNIAAGSQSLANINAMIAAGNTVNYSPQNTVPLLGPVVFLSGGVPQVGLLGAGQTYTIQTSTDLVNWAFLTNVTMAANGGQFVDAIATSNRQRFYRAFSPP
jgi:hypothetical protein